MSVTTRGVRLRAVLYMGQQESTTWCDEGFRSAREPVRSAQDPEGTEMIMHGIGDQVRAKHKRRVLQRTRKRSEPAR